MAFSGQQSWEYETPEAAGAPALWNDVHVPPEDYGPGPPIQTTKVRAPPPDPCPAFRRARKPSRARARLARA